MSKVIYVTIPNDNGYGYSFYRINFGNVLYIKFDNCAGEDANEYGNTEIHLINGEIIYNASKYVIKEVLCDE